MKMIVQYIPEIIAIIIGLGFPIYALLTAGKARKLVEKAGGKKIFLYKEVVILQLVLLALVFLAVSVSKMEIDNVGLSFLNNYFMFPGLILLCAIGFWAVNKINLNEEQAKKTIESYKDVLFMMPKTLAEYKWTTGLSFVAGTFEEIIYRGFLVWQLNQYMPLVPAILIANISFGMSHAATKLKNAVYAFLLGLFFSLTFWLTGSLWLAMLIHVIVDLYSCALAYKAQVAVGNQENELKFDGAS